MTNTCKNCGEAFAAHADGFAGPVCTTIFGIFEPSQPVEQETDEVTQWLPVSWHWYTNTLGGKVTFWDVAQLIRNLSSKKQEVIGNALSTQAISSLPDSRIKRVEQERDAAIARAEKADDVVKGVRAYWQERADDLQARVSQVADVAKRQREACAKACGEGDYYGDTFAKAMRETPLVTEAQQEESPLDAIDRDHAAHETRMAVIRELDAENNARWKDVVEARAERDEAQADNRRLRAELDAANKRIADLEEERDFFKSVCSGEFDDEPPGPRWDDGDLAAVALSMWKRYHRVNSELSALRTKEAPFSAEVERLKQLINTDKTGLAAGLNEVRQIARGYAWIAAGEWGSYSWKERTAQTLQKEVAHLLSLIEETCAAALRASGQRADSAFRLRPPQPEPSRCTCPHSLVTNIPRVSRTDPKCPVHGGGKSQ